MITEYQIEDEVSVLLDKYCIWSNLNSIQSPAFVGDKAWFLYNCAAHPAVRHQHAKGFDIAKYLIGREVQWCNHPSKIILVKEISGTRGGGIEIEQEFEGRAPAIIVLLIHQIYIP